MNKPTFYAFCFLLTLCLLSGCSRGASPAEKAVPVETTVLQSESFDETLDYLGVITDASVTKCSFKTAAILAQINVSKGQYVEKGTVLASLDPSDLTLQVDAAKYQMDSAYATYQKALTGAQSEDLQVAQINEKTTKAAFELAQRHYEAILRLAEAGAVSDIELAQNKLQYEQAQGNYAQAQAMLAKAQGGRPEDVSAARAQYDTARINYNAYQKQLDDLTLIAGQSGYVADILYKTDELIPAGYPAILIRSEAQIIEAGISQQDIRKLSVDTAVTVTVDAETYQGEITNIGQLPDEYSRTFPVEITINEAHDQLYLGATGQVKFVIGQHQGVLLPINAIANDGQDYLYIVKDGKAYRRNLTLQGIYNDRVYVPEVADGETIITSGVKGLYEGCAVTVPEAQVDHAENP